MPLRPHVSQGGGGSSASGRRHSERRHESGRSECRRKDLRTVAKLLAEGVIGYRGYRTWQAAKPPDRKFSAALLAGELGSDAMGSARLRNLPAVDAVLSTPAARVLIERFGLAASTDAIRAALNDARATLQAGGRLVPTAEHIAAQALACLEKQDRSALRPLFNLSGTVLHTNLGRAALAEAAIEAAVAAMRNAVALEFDLETGKRGERDDHVRGLLRSLTGAEDATVVNNNAAAVLLCLNTLANGREAVVSRGELIEIGGAFRMPEIMARAGARLVEVGTTNRTHPRDYLAALDRRNRRDPEGPHLELPHPGLHLRGRNAGARRDRQKGEASPLLHDLGSGALIDLAAYGLEREPTVREALADGADLVTFSGDKLLGGPQAGFIVGKRELIAAINRNPMKRALRVDKIRLAAIEATLKLYRDPDRLAERLPTLRLLARPRQDIEAEAPARSARMSPAPLASAFAVELCECRSQVGSGALPLETIESAGLSIRASAGGRAIEDLARRLRALPTPVIGRIEKDRLMLDFRCLTDEEAFLSNLLHLGDGARRHGRASVRAASLAGRAAVIVGLAGHIDHGKTALVRALTGVDGDRLKEEKARGITIDLGFAFMPDCGGGAARLHRRSGPRALRPYDARGREPASTTRS